MSNGFDENWCKAPDSGLPKPHLVIFMDLAPEIAAERAGFGEELYEKVDFQKKVFQNFKRLVEENWVLINGNQSIEKVSEDIVSAVLRNKPEKNCGLEKLWPLNTEKV